MYDQKLSSITIYYKKQACKIYQSQSTYHLEFNKFDKSSEFHMHKHMCKGYFINHLTSSNCVTPFNHRCITYADIILLSQYPY